jgi:lysosomal alpha-mannosidase
MYVEIYYFQRWWMDARTSDAQRQDVKALMASGQWEFVEGGWVMPDEATTTYSAVMDQLTEGHLFLNRTFGVTPKIGWQIDPFGASTAIAAHYRLAGFKYHVIDRINYKLKASLIASQAMEFWWSPEASSPSSSIFTHILDDNYCFPMQSGFDFEADSTSNPPVTNENIKERATQYAQQVRLRQPMWRTSTMLMLHQCDFKYQNAALQFDNMDKIIDYINQNPTVFNMTIKWSLLSEYFTSLDSKYPQSTFPSRGAQDFFPYDDNDDSWWSGYFTSRPGLKGLVRQSEAELRAVDTLSSYLAAADLSFPGLPPSIDFLHQTLGIAQHHDAVSGTEKQAVADHYAALLWEARAGTTPLIANYLNLIAKRVPTSSASPNWTNSTNLVKNLALGGSVTILAYNSLYKGRWEVMKIPVWSADITVTCLGSPVPSQILSNLMPVESGAPYTLFVSATTRIPPAGYITCKLSRPSKAKSPPTIAAKSSGAISNTYLSLTIEQGYYSELSILGRTPQPFPFFQSIMAYDSYSGPGQASGAYIFRPTGSASEIGGAPTTTIRDTPVVKEVHQVFSPYASQTTRLYGDSSGYYLDVSYRIGPLPGNKELISRWETGLRTSAGELYSDDNGWSVMARTQDTTDRLKIPANYYPSVYSTYITPSTSSGQAEGIHFGIATDRSHGVSSVDVGTIEVMMHRRLLQDDKRGVEEPLNDTTIITTNQRLVFGLGLKEGSASRLHHALELNFPLTILYSNAAKFEDSFFPSWNASLGLKHGMQVISARLINPSSRQILVRLANIFSAAEGGQVIPVDLNQIFNAPMCNFQETSLTGMIVYKDNASNLVDFAPKDIKTFLLTPC